MKINEQNAERREARKDLKLVQTWFFFEVDQRVEPSQAYSFQWWSEGKKRFLQKYANVELVFSGFQAFHEHCAQLFEEERITLSRRCIFTISLNLKRGVSNHPELEIN